MAGQDQKTMKAVVLKGPNELEYCDVPMPQAGIFEVVCRVESVSVCGSDPHIINGEYIGFNPKEYPHIPGHEWAGVIVELGEKTADFGWKAGDRVCGGSHAGCGQCRNCMEGRYTICLNYGNTNVNRHYGHNAAGAYAQYIAASVRSIAKIPDKMDFDVASCMDPFSIALHVLLRSKIEPGDTVLVNGVGAPGLFSILHARNMGAGLVIASDTGNRLEIARRFGAVAIDFKQENVTEMVLKLTHGEGAKRVVECTGTAAGIRQSCEVAAKGGCISMISLPATDVSIPIRNIVLNEIEIVGNRANPNTLERSVVIAGNYLEQINSLITHRFPLTAYQEALDVFISKKENAFKVVMKP